jgi:hypothetical protein
MSQPRVTVASGNQIQPGQKYLPPEEEKASQAEDAVDVRAGIQ